MKVDKGFELLYHNLSYRRKFIRTIWVILFVILFLGKLYLSGSYLNRGVRIFSLMAVIIAPIQLKYNYSKWKEEERNNNE